MLGGTVMAVLAFQVFLRKDATHPLGVLNRLGYQQYGLVGAAVMFVTILATCIGTQGRCIVPALNSERRTFGAQLDELRAMLSNRSFLSLMIAGIIASIGAGLSSGLGLYITTYFWELTPKEISYL